MELINLQERIQINFEDYRKATGFQREPRMEFLTKQDKNDDLSEFDEDSDDLLSVESDDIEAPDFENMHKQLELNHNGTKEVPLLDDSKDDDQLIIGSSKQLEIEFEENFDSMVLDEGVTAT